MTFRQDSDIKSYYGGFMDIATGKMVVPKTDTMWKQPDFSFKGEKDLIFVYMFFYRLKLIIEYVH